MTPQNGYEYYHTCSKTRGNSEGVPVPIENRRDERIVDEVGIELVTVNGARMERRKKRIKAEGRGRVEIS